MARKQTGGYPPIRIAPTEVLPVRSAGFNLPVVQVWDEAVPIYLLAAI
ncbi:MAG TPA: hypothetical protein VI199_02815 [Novosphingobium sp.]|nr:hypothetical protein [Novosphingobium sp.]